MPIYGGKIEGGISNALNMAREKAVDFLSGANVQIGPSPYKEEGKAASTNRGIAKFIVDLFWPKMDVGGIQDIVNMAMPLQIGPVFHGSGAKFSRFANEKIGTGEGTQAFGYGHYFTDAKEIAESYAKAARPVKIGGMDIPVDSRWYRELSYLSDPQNFKNYPEALDELKTSIKRELNWYENSNAPVMKGRREWDTKVLGLLEKGVLPERAGGKVYEATLHKGKDPSQYDYLKWDEPASEKQKSAIFDEFLNHRRELGRAKEDQYLTDQEADSLREFLSRKYDNSDPSGKLTGRTIYKYFSNILGSQKEASAFLQRAGIDGIKYPSGTLSGIKGSDKYNYVVFDPTDITIERVK